MGDLRYWIGLNRVPTIGAARTAALIESFGDVEVAWRAGLTALKAAGLPQAAAERLVYFRERMDLDAELHRMEACGVRAITWESPEYPQLLKKIEYPPPLLYIKGDLLPADDWAVAVVGTRSPTTYGKEVAQQMARGLAEAGVTVVSGLAMGVDGIAHRAALDGGGRTLAVLGCGLDYIYPSTHKALAERVAASGALLSDYPLGTEPEASNFPPRNRIISGLSLGAVVVEAGVKSGALITLKYALEQGRETFCVPGNTFSRASEGANLAIQRGEAKLVMTVRDVLEELNLTMVSEHRQVRETVPADDSERALLACLSDDPTHIDAVVRATGLAAGAVSSTLCMMELKGMVRCVDRMHYVLAH